jgi:hypothetical protein
MMFPRLLLLTTAFLSAFHSFAQNDNSATKHDISQTFSSLISANDKDNSTGKAEHGVKLVSPIPNQKSFSKIEQTSFGTKPAAALVASFDGLGVGFKGPQGTANLRNPSDNSLAVGPDHIVQSVNSVMAIFTKKGKRFDSTGGVLYGPVRTANVFRGFGGPCERINNGDAVIRYDQLADRWLIVMPTFRKAALRNDSLATKLPQPGNAVDLYQPPYTPPDTRDSTGSYCMCYAISTSSDPMGSYYRYEFKRDLFPDYPRPTVWPDGYYTTTSTGDDVIERHAYVVDRTKMLKGEDATEQSFILKDVNFIINADLDGKELPPPGSPSIMMATGGTQLKKVLGDDGIYVWKYFVDWKDPSKTKLEGPVKIAVEPYEYMGGGQLTKTIPQPGVEQRLDSQGDKLMARLVYRRIGNQQSIVAVHSVNTVSGGGVRWYEFRVNKKGDVDLFQQGTYAPEGNYRWMASPAMDKNGNIGIGYSFGGPNDFPGQRFAGRLAKDKEGMLTLNETVLVNGEAAQTTTLRWEDYTQTAVDPVDDCTIWYVGDYLKKDSKSYSTKIGAFRMKGCK